MSKKNALFPQVKENISFDTLWQQAAEPLETLSGAIWTDTGEHDPGVTLLQSVTWNTSDLAYRASLSLNDLLTRKDESTLFPREFGPQNVLTCNTVTPDDYRRALLDLHSTDAGLDTVAQDFLFNDALLIKEPESSRYHWWYDAEHREYTFTPPPDEKAAGWTLLTLRGNYWLYIMPTRYTQGLSSDNRKRVESYLSDFLTNHRNLGERVTNIIWLQPVTFSPQFTINLSDDVSDVNQVVAQIYQVVTEALLPKQKRHTTAELQAQGFSNEAIFEGPLLQHGWLPESTSLISDAGLVLNLTPLFSQLLAINGIASIGEFSPGKLPSQITAIKDDAWSWQVASGYYPQLWGDDPLAVLAGSSSPLTLIAKGGIRQPIDATRVATYLTPPTLIQTEAITLPAGKLRDLDRYTPIGDRLPECYQMQQPLALIDDKVKSLHQFLLPIDQLLADGGAELKQVPALLAFKQRGDVIRGTRWPYAAESVNQAVNQQYANALIGFERQDCAIFAADGTTPNEANFTRELDFLQYLLGYFGTRRASRPLTLNRADFLATQRAWLAQQPALGYDRINIRIDQVSALQKRIAARIGLDSECFADKPDLGKLPFYLIEHRQLLPLLPDKTYNAAQAPDDFSYSKPILTITVKGSAGKIVKGQLIDLIAMEGNSKLQVAQQLVTSVSGDTFTISTENSQQLKNDLDRLQAAWKNKKLQFINSTVWLQDMDYRLNYAPAASQPADSSQRLLASSDQTPYPSMVGEGDKIIITPTQLASSLSGDPGNSPRGTPPDNESGQIVATIIEVNQIAGTLLIKKESGGAFPAAADAWRYQWNFSDSSYATSDRFSFVVSVVHNRALIENARIDADKLFAWLEKTIMEEFPAHVSLISHWMSATAFKNFAATYKRWQNNGNPLGDDAYAIMQMLTLGHLPVAQLGIGLMRIATDAQRTEVMGTSGTEWHTEVILKDELFYVPK